MNFEDFIRSNVYIPNHPDFDIEIEVNISEFIEKYLDDDKKKDTKLETPKVSVCIVSAKYGASDSWVDVTEKASKMYSDKHEIKSCNRLGGDPCYGKPKKLIVEFENEGSVFTREVKEGKYFRI
jgi:hypothetical protein